MKDWMVALVAFLFFAALLAVGVVLIAVDILRAYAVDHRDTKRRLQQSITKPSVPLPPLRPRSPLVIVAKRVALAPFQAFSGACAWGWRLCSRSCILRRKTLARVRASRCSCPVKCSRPSGPESTLRYHDVDLSLPETETADRHPRIGRILASDERYLQADLVCIDRTFPIAGCVGSRDPCASTCCSRKSYPGVSL